MVPAVRFYESKRSSRSKARASGYFPDIGQKVGYFALWTVPSDSALVGCHNTSPGSKNLFAPYSGPNVRKVPDPSMITES